jgi:hypothetical protein
MPDSADSTHTIELFRDDARLAQCDAVVVALDERGVRLDRTVFYPQGGGQAGDRGQLVAANGVAIDIADTRKGEQPGEIVHVPAAGQEAALGALRAGSASAPASTGRAATATCASIRPRICCARSCRIRSTAARSRPTMRGSIST